jgi:hypothetical protein
VHSLSLCLSSTLGKIFSKGDRKFACLCERVSFFCLVRCFSSVCTHRARVQSLLWCMLFHSNK